MHAHPRAASQRCAAEIASSRSVSLAMDSIASPTKAWIKQRLRFLLGKPARLQIEQQALVERA